MELTASPKSIPVQGRSEEVGLRMRCIESSGTPPHRPDSGSPGTVKERLAAVAPKNPSTSFS